MLSKIKRIPHKMDCVKKPGKSIKVTQRDVDELNAKIRKDIESNRRRETSFEAIKTTQVINRNSEWKEKYYES